MISIIAFLVKSKFGRWLAGAGIVLAGLAVTFLKVFLAGKANEKAKNTKQSLNNLRERVKNDEKIRKDGASVARDKLRRSWVRND